MMEMYQFILLAAAALGAVIALSKPETLEEMAERIARKDGRKRAK